MGDRAGVMGNFEGAEHRFRCFLEQTWEWAGVGGAQPRGGLCLRDPYPSPAFSEPVDLVEEKVWWVPLWFQHFLHL